MNRFTSTWTDALVIGQKWPKTATQKINNYLYERCGFSTGRTGSCCTGSYNRYRRLAVNSTYCWFLLRVGMPLLYLWFTAKSEFYHKTTLFPNMLEQLTNHLVHWKKIQDEKTLVTMTIFIHRYYGGYCKKCRSSWRWYFFYCQLNSRYLQSYKIN